MVLNPIKRTYNRIRGNILWSRAEELATQGHEQEAQELYLQAFRHYMRSRRDYDDRPLRENPMATELKTNWQKYGFENAEEAHSYTMWILRQSMQCMAAGTPQSEFGYNGLHSPEEILERYPIDEFQADMDIRHGRVMKFPDGQSAVDFLKSELDLE